MSAERMERYPLYLYMQSADEYIQIDDFGLDFKDTMVGVFDISGSLAFVEKEALKTTERTLYLCSDLCGDQSILNNGLRLPVLRELSFKGKNNAVMSSSYSSPLWINTDGGVVRRIRLYLRDALGQTPSLERCFLKCTLLVWYKRFDREQDNG